MKSMIVAVAVGLPLAAISQVFDTGEVLVTAEVVGDITVTQQHGVDGIDLGQLVPGANFEVLADGVDDYYPRATFLIEGPDSVDWQLTVSYLPLVGPGAEVITIGAPSGPDICFAETDGATDGDCLFLNSGESVDRADHDDEGYAMVGYSVSVPDPAATGIYSRADAITLRADAILGN